MAIRINDNGTERNMTSAEEAEYLAYASARQAEAEAQAEAQAERAILRTALLTRLGITSDEAKLLLG